MVAHPSFLLLHCKACVLYSVRICVSNGFFKKACQCSLLMHSGYQPKSPSLSNSLLCSIFFLYAWSVIACWTVISYCISGLALFAMCLEVTNKIQIDKQS